MGLLWQGRRELDGALGMIGKQQSGDFVPDQGIQVVGGHELVPCHALFHLADDIHRGLDTDIRGNQGLLKLVQDFLVHTVLSADQLVELAEEGCAGLFQPGLERLLLFGTIEKAHAGRGIRIRDTKSPGNPGQGSGDPVSVRTHAELKKTAPCSGGRTTPAERSMPRGRTPAREDQRGAEQPAP